MAHPFFDADTYPSDRPEAQEFHRVLCNVIRGDREISLIYDHCGGQRPLTPNQPRNVMWDEVLRNLTSEGNLKNLCEEIRKKYPKNKRIQQVISNVEDAQTVEEDVPNIPPGPDLSTRDLLFQGHPILGRFFTLNPLILAGALSLAAILFLVIPSLFLKIASIKCSNGNQGILHPANWNWGIMYTIVLPVLFGLAVRTFQSMRDGVFSLYRRLKVIRIRTGVSATDYLQALSDHLAQSAKTVLIVTTIFTGAAMILDIWDVWYGYISGTFPYSIKPNWDNAFTGFNPAKYLDPKVSSVTCPDLNPPPPSKFSNGLFAIVAYTFQGASIFLGLFWVSKFWLFLRALSDLLREEGSNYCIRLVENDPTRRLGLRPMGKMFNAFLLITVFLQIYVLVHRIQVIGQWRLDQRLYSYIPQVWDGFFQISSWRQVSFYGFDGLRDPGIWIALILITFPIIAVCYFPLYKLRGYIKRCKDAAYEEYLNKHDEAVKAGDQKMANEYERKMNQLDRATVWPNGDDTALRFLCAMLILSIGSWLPPFLPILICLWILLEILLLFTRRKTRS